MTTHISIEEQDRRATEHVLDLVIRQGHPVVVVDSPPGAGKTTLVEKVVAVAVQHTRLRVAVVTPRAEQTYDILRRLATRYAPMLIQPFQSSTRTLPPDLAGNPRILPPASHVRGLFSGPGVVVGTSAKFLLAVEDFGHQAFDILIGDEMYQLAAKDFAPLYQLARQTLLVGDPGQLDPFILSDTTAFEGAPFKMHWPVPRELLHRITGVPIVRLPATRRLPQDTVDLIQPTLYPHLPFVSAVFRDERRLAYRVLGINSPIDRVLELLADGATVVGLVLPRLEFGAGYADEELSAVTAEIVRRFNDRGAEWGGRRILGARDFGCVDAHVVSGAATQRNLRQRGISTDEVMVQTPEVWQGLERPLIVIKHPLSGVPSPTSFDLAPGRLCVALSRHQLGCVIVARDGVGETLERYCHDCGERPMGADDVEWVGYRAHCFLWSELERRGRLVRM